MEFTVLLLCSKSDLLFYEQRAIDILKPRYNLSPTAGNTLGLKWSLESRRRKAEQVRGTKASPEAIEKKRQSLLGQFWITDGNRNRKLRPGNSMPDGWRAGMTNQGAGWKHTDEAKAKMKGRRFSDSHRANISAALLGRPGPMLGKPVSLETRLKISVKLKGCSRSPESIAKQKATWAARRELKVEMK